MGSSTWGVFLSPHSGQQSNKMASISDQSLQMGSALKVDEGRMAREFFTPEPISMTGNYYPRYRVEGVSSTGSGHVTYLSRPTYCYKIPSKYGSLSTSLLGSYRKQ